MNTNTSPITYEPEEPMLSGLGDARKLGPFRSALARMRLSTKLALLVMMILFSGLVLASVLTAALLQRNLVQQVDDDLGNTYSSIAYQLLNADQQGDSLLPSNYYMLYRSTDRNGVMRDWFTPETMDIHGLPNLDAYMPADPADYANALYSKPFTVKSYNDTDWRVTVRAIYNNQTGDAVGVVYIALPLSETYSLIDQIQRVLLISAMGITVIGGCVGVIAVNRSLTPLSRMEQTAALIASGDLSQRVPQSPSGTEIGSLAQSLNSMLSQLELAFAERERSEHKMRRFVSDASHELRTPLATVQGYGELYRMGAITSSEQMDDTMRRIEDSARRMATLVEDLLHLARLDESRPLKSDPIDLSVLALDAISDLHALDPSRAVSVAGLSGSGTPSAGSLVVIGDEDRLRQVFANLVGNIARHTADGTAAEIALGRTQSAQGDRVVIEFRDHGEGVDPEHASRIFERFYRVDSSRNRKSGGSGLGLAIVAAIVQAHQGKITVSETTGGGLTVRIELPATAPEHLSDLNDVPQ